MDVVADGAPARNTDRKMMISAFIQCFARERRGVWRCVRSCSFESPVGRIEVTMGTVITRGTRWMNYDLAAALDEECERQEKRHPA